MLTLMRARLDAGATHKEVMAEFGVSGNVVSSVRKSQRFSKAHLTALKNNLPNAFAQIAHESLATITPEKLSACSAPQLMMVSGVATDKMRLLSDQSTANISFKDAGAMAVDALANSRELFETTAKDITGSALEINTISDAKLVDNASPTEK